MCTDIYQNHFYIIGSWASFFIIVASLVFIVEKIVISFRALARGVVKDAVCETIKDAPELKAGTSDKD